jgi:hypothetical protein
LFQDALVLLRRLEQCMYSASWSPQNWNKMPY